MSEFKALDTDNPAIQEEILHLIAQYLQDTGLTNAATAVHDAVGSQARYRHQTIALADRIRNDIKTGKLDVALSGARELLTLVPEKTGAARRLLEAWNYAVHRQYYLETLDRREHQQAFSFL
eukprot:UC1_evm1s1630